MPLFSIITILGSIYIVFRNDTLKNKYRYMLIFSAIAETIRIRGLFIPGGAGGIAQATVLQFVTVFLAILLLFKQKNKPSVSFFTIATLFLSSVLIGGGYEYVNTFDQPVIPRHLSNDVVGSAWDWFIAGMVARQVEPYSITEFLSGFLKVVFIVFNIYCIKSICDWKDIGFIVNRLIYILKCYLIVVYVEFFLKNIFNMADLWPDIQQLFCGAFAPGDLNQAPDKRGTFYSLIGFTQEPSFLVMSFAVLLFLVFIANKVNQKYPGQTILPYTPRYQIVLILLPMLVSGGFSSVWYILNLAVIYYIISNDVSSKSLLYQCVLFFRFSVPLILILGLLYAFIQLSDSNYSMRIEAVQLFLTSLFTTGTLPFNIMTDTSVLARFSSIVLTFKDFLARPIFGLGVGMEFAHCFSVTMLADFGILGSYLWWKLLMCSQYKGVKYDYCALFIYFWIIGLIAGDFGVRFLRQFSNFILVEATCLYCSNIPQNYFLSTEKAEVDK